MNFIPIEDEDGQKNALLLIYRAFNGENSTATMPASGSRKDNKTQTKWRWNIEQKSGSDTLLFINRFHRPSESPVTFTVPLDVRDINDGGLIARDDDSGERYLCRQRIGKDNILGGKRSDPFAPGWTGEAYPSFDVIGKPSTRTYYACVPLDRGSDVILDKLALLLEHRPMLPRGISKEKARRAMSDYYNANRETYTPNEDATIRSSRDEIVKLLQGGMGAHDVFVIVLGKD